jgi:malonyl-CoA/methylmalonyl-CoA synthetase
MTNHLFSGIRARMPGREKTFIETADGKILTYGDLVDETGRFANLLVRLGVKPGDRVAVQVEKSPQVIVLSLACARLGAIFLPLNTQYTVAELEYFLTDAEPALIVCSPQKREQIAAIAARTGVAAIETMDQAGGGTLPDKARAMAADFTDIARAADDVAAILYTSGTTGRPKGAMQTHGSLASNALTLVDYWHMTAADVLLHALPVFHTHGLFTASYTLLMAGGSMLFLPKFDPDDVLALLPRATVMMGVPTFYTRLLQHPGLTKAATAHMRLFVSGSAPMLSETHQEWHERTGHSILERYGMTETGMNTSNPLVGERLAGSVGLPLPGIAVRIADPRTGVVLPQGEVGVIEVRGPNLFKGYWRMPDKTAEDFRPDGYFITGDLGRIDQRGYVHIVGRGKDLIISGGFNVYPKEVEDVINALPGVAESAVIGLPHRDFGEGVTALVVQKEGAELSESAILHAVSGRLAKFKQPKRVLFVDDLPRNALGKVRKDMLRTSFAGLYA